MRVVDEGHTYMLDMLDAEEQAWMVPVLRFVKREGPMYPGNKGTQAGVIIQEVLRVLINRFEYVHRQAIALHDFESAEEDKKCIVKIKEIFLILEERAARRHQRKLPLIEPEKYNIHLLPACLKCGHVKCAIHKKGD